MNHTTIPINFERINSSSDMVSLEFIRTLFEEAFPPDERRAFDRLLSLTDTEKAFRLYRLSVGNRAVGMLSFWEWDDWLYVEHFAFERSQRGGGYGGRTLEHLIGVKQRPIVLEVEMPEDETSIRRIHFYERLGFRLWSAFSYIQPPYDASKRPLELRLMVHGGIEPTPEHFAAISERLYRVVYGVCQ